MSDSYNDHQPNSKNFESSRDGGRRGGFRGARGQNNRDGGGFRIRLSDNEMRSARSLQEAFNLRSTIAVLGFALRTLGQMLEEGKLDEIIHEYKNQSLNSNNRRNQDGRSNRFNNQRQTEAIEIKANPFERPSKPSSSEKISDCEIDVPLEEKDINEPIQENIKSNNDPMEKNSED